MPTAKVVIRTPWTSVDGMGRETITKSGSCASQAINLGCPTDTTEDRRPVTLSGTLDRGEIEPDEQALVGATRRDKAQLAPIVLRTRPTARQRQPKAQVAQEAARLRAQEVSPGS